MDGRKPLLRDPGILELVPRPAAVPDLKGRKPGRRKTGNPAEVEVMNESRGGARRFTLPKSCFSSNGIFPKVKYQVIITSQVTFFLDVIQTPLFETRLNGSQKLFDMLYGKLRRLQS